MMNSRGLYCKLRIILLLFAVLIIFADDRTQVSAADSQYDCNLSNLWDNECYLAPDSVNTKIGYDQSMHFVDVIEVGNEYYFYGIRGTTNGAGVGLMTTTDGIHFVDKGIVYTPETGVTYDSFPGIYYENGVFYLYSERGVFGVNTYQVQLSTSTDGTHFTRQGIVLSPTSGNWDSGGVGTPTMIKKGSTYYLFYHGSNGVDMCSGVATSSSPTGPFTKYGQIPVLPCGPAGSFDGGTAGKRDIVQEGSYYYMVYEGSTDAANADFSGATWSSGFARSSDLLVWEKYHQNAVLPGAYPELPYGQGFGNDGPAFVDINGEKWVYYRGSSGANFTKRARLANEVSGGGYDVLLEAENMTHQVGAAVADGWNATQASHSAGYMISGQTASHNRGGENIAIFKGRINNNTLNNAVVMRIEVYDDTANSLVASRSITRGQFKQANHDEFFVLPYYSVAGHSLQYRVYWYDNSDITLDRVLIKYGDEQRYSLQNPKVYEAEGVSFGHSIGRADGDGWSANTVQDNTGYLTYGPYATDISTGSRAVRFRMMIDNNTIDNTNVVKLEVFDVTAGVVLGQETITRQKFREAYAYQEFPVVFNNATAGHQIEFRVLWYDNAYIKVDYIYVDSYSIQQFEAESTQMFHANGRADGDGWSANVAQDQANYMLYGPYVNYVTAGSRTASFRMMVDNNTFDNSPVVTIEVFDATANTLLSSSIITRQQFSSTNSYQDFILPFTYANPGNSLELRVLWHDSSYVNVDSIKIL